MREETAKAKSSRDYKRLSYNLVVKKGKSTIDITLEYVHCIRRVTSIAEVQTKEHILLTYMNVPKTSDELSTIATTSVYKFKGFTPKPFSYEKSDDSTALKMLTKSNIPGNYAIFPLLSEWLHGRCLSTHHISSFELALNR